MTERARTNDARRLRRTLHAAGALGLVLLLSAAAYETATALGLSHSFEAAALPAPEAERLTVMRRELAALERRAATLERQTRALRLRMPDAPGEDQFLKELTAAAERAGVEIRSHSLAAPSAWAGRWQIQVSLSCSGGYEGLCRFVDEIASLPRLANVIGLRVLAAEDGPYPLELTLAIYFTGATAEVKPGSEGVSRG